MSEKYERAERFKERATATPPPGPQPSTNGHHKQKETQQTEEPPLTIEGIATLGSLELAGAKTAWIWPDWIQDEVLNALAAEGGLGKTRFCADLIRRIRHGLPWPDGKPMLLPMDTRVMWVPADNNHHELVSLAKDFGITDSIWLNAPKDEPYSGVTLDTLEDFTNLDARVAVVKPRILIVDTVGNATEKNLSSQEDAKSFYQPLQVIALRHKCATLCLTHLNSTGAFLGRRVIEKVRVALRMTKPDEQDERRKLEVYKTNGKRPAPLGLTMLDNRNDYDTDPPTSGTSEPGAGAGSTTPRLDECCRWLKEHLAGDFVYYVSDVRKAAQAAGFGANTLYKAVHKLKVVESLDDTRRKSWTLETGR